MSDPIDDLINLRLAGYYTPGVDPDEEVIEVQAWGHEPVRIPAGNRGKEPHPHAAQPRAMLTVADLVAELATVRALLKAVVATNPACQIANPRNWWECEYCHFQLVMHRIDVPDFANHAPACPWRQAAEYIEKVEAKHE